MVSSLNRLPLNQATVSKPTRPPDAIARKSSPASSPNRAGAGSACRSIRVNMWSGSRPTSSANMQKTRRLTKWATACRVVPPLSQRLGDGRERRRDALGERLPGLPWPQTFRVARERPLQPVARRRIGQIVELELVGPADAVRPVGADPEPHHVGHDQQRRVLQRQRVLPELVERRVEVGAPPLVFPGEVVALPDVGPAVAAGVPARSSLEAVRLTRRVGVGWRRFAQRSADGTGR